MISKVAFFSVVLLIASNLFAQDELSYYPQEFIKIFKQKDGKNSEEIKNFVFKVLQNAHLKKQNQNDTLIANCNQVDETLKKSCYAQVANDYSTARRYLFGKLHLIKTSEGQEIEDVYCHKKITTSIGPMQIPSDKVLNCEHTWPQSKFSHKFSTDMQKGDLHHLYPADPLANNIRGNNLFGEVSGKPLSNCDASSIGGSTVDGGSYFEPPKEHKGNVARALFYFSVRYQLPISDKEESFLRDWNKEDPIDQEELDRNDEIFKIQGNRNPFIDFPDLADLIDNF